MNSSKERITITKRNFKLILDKPKIAILRDTLSQFEKISAELIILIKDDKVKFYVVSLGSTKAAELIFDFNYSKEFPDINLKDRIYCDKLVKFLKGINTEFFDTLEINFIDKKNDYSLDISLKSKILDKKFKLKRVQEDKRVMAISSRPFERTIELEKNLFEKMIDPIFEHILITLRSLTLSTEEYNYSKNRGYPIYTTKKFKSQKDKKLYQGTYHQSGLAFAMIENQETLEFSIDNKGPARIEYCGEDYKISFAFAPRVRDF